LFADAALAIAASQGDRSFFDQIVGKLKSTNDQILQHRYMEALYHFENPELVKRALELGISGTIRNQDSTKYIAHFLRNPVTRAEAWKFVRTRWNDVEKTFTTSSGASLVVSAGSFCDDEAASNVSAFFKVHPVPASERALRQAIERIRACVDLKKLQEANLERWLSQHRGSPGAMK
jgi:aminopeptidase N